MSTQSVPTRRRRIAGERGPRTSSPTAPAASPETVATESGASRPRRRLPTWLLPRWLLVGLVLVLAGAVTFDLVATVRLRADRTTAADNAAASRSALNAAPAQAEQAAEALLSYGYKTLQSDADAAKPYLTAQYAETFQRTVDDFLAKPARTARGEVRAEVKASGVISSSPAAVEVLLFVDQTSGGSEDPRTALNRVVLSMVEQGGRWLVDDVTAL